MSGFYAFHETAIGESHVKVEKICQDASLSFEGEEYAVAIVCDGHGGWRYFRSDRGARIAVEESMNAIHELLEKRTLKDPNADSGIILKQLAATIISRWRERIALDYRADPFSEEEKKILSLTDISTYEKNEGWVSAYGTTLIAVVRAVDFWFGLHIGDGKCVTISPEGECAQPIPWDERCFLNFTTSLCEIDALSRFRYVFQKENLPKAIFLGTDGTDGSFNNDEALNEFYLIILKLFEEEGIEHVKNKLHFFLPKLSDKGNGDDVSIAGIIHA